jgi:hypothetical protein
MLGIGAFILLHLALVALHPETLKAMILPVAAEKEDRR